MKEYTIRWENLLQFGKSGVYGTYNNYAEAHAALKKLIAQNNDEIVPSDINNPYVFTTVCGYWIIDRC